MSPRMDNINNFSLSNNNENNNNIVEINNADLNDYIEFIDDIYYEENEQNRTKYNLILCELYNTRLHGDVDTTNIYNYYLVMWKYKKLNIEMINEDCESSHNEYLYMMNQTHSIYRNFVRFRR